MNELYFKTKLCIGDNSLKHLEKYENKKIFLVTDPFLISSKTIDVILEKISSSNEVSIFSEIIPDPPIENVSKGLEKLKESNAEVMIAVGGGSAIDAGKGMKFFGEQMKIINDLEFVAIPTTSGTGSEVTSFSVITNEETKVKYPIISDSILPDIAILDANLVKTAPKVITADTGIDVLTHGIEAYVSINANDFSDALAEKAIQIVFEYLECAYENGDNIKAREKMHNASTLAGMAFNITSLGINHGIAHIAGAKFKIPHGRMNSILLREVIKFNAKDNKTKSKYCKLAKILNLTTSSNEDVCIRSLINKIKDLQNKLNMPLSLRECSVTKDQFILEKENIIKGALNDRCTETNPKEVNEKDIELILNEIM